MAWTAPKTYTAGETINADILNTHIRDNLRYLKGLDGDITLSDDVITAFLVDGVDISDHNARHESGGGDALAAPISINAMPDLTTNKIWRGNVSNRPEEI